jgi:hypothetical protein
MIFLMLIKYVFLKSSNVSYEKNILEIRNEFLWFVVANIIMEKKLYIGYRKEINEKGEIEIQTNSILKLIDICKTEGIIYKIMYIKNKKNTNINEMNLLLPYEHFLYLLGETEHHFLTEIEFLAKKIIIIQPERKKEFKILIKKEKIKKIFIV